MIIIEVENNINSRSKDVELPHAGMIVDPTHIGFERCKFRFVVKGTTLTIKRPGSKYSWKAFKLRVYLPTEDIPDFASTVYTYHGLDGEQAPTDVTEVIFAPSVTIIKEYAFYGCRFLRWIAIPDNVTRIEWRAFHGCDSLRSIQFSCNLEFIGVWAFSNCKSLERVFLPPTVTHIDDDAFRNCKSLRFFNLPTSIEHLGNMVVYGCGGLLTTEVQYGCGYDEYGTIANNEEVNEWLKNRHNNFPLYIVSYSTSVTAQMIQECMHAKAAKIYGDRKKNKHRRLFNRLKSLCAGSDRQVIESDEQEMPAFHILCANPHITGDAIRTYLQLVPDTAIIKDSTGMTGLHILCSVPYQETSTGDAIRAYLELAPAAVEQRDFDGMTPFQYLCMSDVTFLEDRDFSSLMIWWYHCMP